MNRKPGFSYIIKREFSVIISGNDQTPLFLFPIPVMFFHALGLLEAVCLEYLRDSGDAFFLCNCSRANHFRYFSLPVHFPRIAGNSGNDECIPFLSPCMYRTSRFLTIDEKAKPLSLPHPPRYWNAVTLFFVFFLLSVLNFTNSVNLYILTNVRHINIKCFDNWTTHQKPLFVRGIYIGKVCIFKDGYTPKGAVLPFNPVTYFNHIRGEHESCHRRCYKYSKWRNKMSSIFIVNPVYLQGVNPGGVADDQKGGLDGHQSTD